MMYDEGQFGYLEKAEIDNLLRAIDPDMTGDRIAQRMDQIMKELFSSLNIGITAKEMQDVFTKLDKSGDGELDLHELDTALRLCASSCVVTVEWVKGLFAKAVEQRQLAVIEANPCKKADLKTVRGSKPPAKEVCLFELTSVFGACRPVRRRRRPQAPD